VKKLILGIFVTGLLAAVNAGPARAEAKFLGVKKCKMCHMKQYKTWESSKHSKNFSQLQGDELKDPECLKCHTTGFGEGGYGLDQPAEHNANFENTQCEACHGPGGDHMKAPKAQKKETIQRKSTACANCHNPHVSFGEMAKEKRGK